MIFLKKKTSDEKKYIENGDNNIPMTNKDPEGYFLLP